ncbi:HIT-like domain-containing protein [Auriculariales sp. MPI-PUGE-AT-0066]|nr:HIT-like domain-containing protein [Auriculariales sp. MPI-PUGE-AT-0066]
MPAPSLNALREYAALANPGTLPPSVLFAHTEQTVTIIDVYPKSKFHLLVLPRVPALGSTEQLGSLKTLLQDKDHARTVLDVLASDAEEAKKGILEEMQTRYGFKWGVRMGFHAVPSMLHLHLHVMSDELVSDRIKHKKHYLSFHPTHGFWLPLEDVRGWLEATEEYYTRMAKLPEKQYEPLLRQELRCFRCDGEFKNFPALKAHLQQEWDKVEKRELAKVKKSAGSQANDKAKEGQGMKRKVEDDAVTVQVEPKPKRQAL